ncbi:MAG: hypothetical protein H6661_07430 [Ardenticatenaceae bacterium]|nr:hypothetical protein [Ardenticatenaceae bacterium]
MSSAALLKMLELFNTAGRNMPAISWASRQRQTITMLHWLNCSSLPPGKTRRAAAAHLNLQLGAGTKVAGRRG